MIRFNAVPDKPVHPHFWRPDPAHSGQGNPLTPSSAWATALMVKGSLEGARLARRYKLDALFIDREGDHLRETRAGRLFEPRPDIR